MIDCLFVYVLSFHAGAGSDEEAVLPGKWRRVQGRRKQKGIKERKKTNEVKERETKTRKGKIQLELQVFPKICRKFCASKEQTGDAAAKHRVPTGLRPGWFSNHGVAGRESVDSSWDVSICKLTCK